MFNYFEIHNAHRIIPNDIDNPSFDLAPPGGQHFYLSC